MELEISIKPIPQYMKEKTGTIKSVTTINKFIAELSTYKEYHQRITCILKAVIPILI
jgi:hypothetical protein